MSKVSVIIPVYNAEKYIKQTIGSVLSQTYSDWELIAVDDGSRDRSLEILKEYVMMNQFFSNLKARVLLPTSSTIHVSEKL